MRVAIVHDWLVTRAGAERVLEQMIALFPKADLFTLVDFLPKAERGFLKEISVKTSRIQSLPFARKKYRSYLPLMPYAIEQFDLSSYDLVLSSSHAVAKGVLISPEQLHICLCYSPMRYAWDMQHEYLSQAKLTSGLWSFFARYTLHRLRIWDVRTVYGVDHFIAISHYIAKRIKRCYRRSSEVIYPPVCLDFFTPRQAKEDFYLTASRFVPYKRIDLIVEAFRKMPHKRLVVIGDGPEFKKIKNRLTPNIELIGFQPANVLKDHMQRARAFIFAAKEDFGIVPIEALACGTPVIAYGRGGALETITRETGHFFYRQDPESIQKAIEEFEVLTFCSKACRRQAERFSQERWQSEFKSFVDRAVKTWKDEQKMELSGSNFPS